MKKEVPERKKNPWFNASLKQQKQLVRRRERIWRKYHQGHQWVAFSKERTKYKRMLSNNKTEKIKKRVIDCGRDSKKMYKLIRNLTGTESENPLPPASSNAELADDFADFFISKITKIREKLDQL